MPLSPIKIASKPGIKRDGTLLEGGAYVDGQWCRWHRGLPRKIRGYTRVVQSLTEKAYGMHAFASNGQEYIHTGSASKVLQYTLDYNGTLLTSSDRTPAAYVSVPNNLWQFDVLYDSVSSSNRLIAHPGANLSLVDSTTQATIYYGDVAGTAALTTTGVTASGGIVVLAPYLCKFGSDGLFEWSVGNKPNDFTTTTGTAPAGAARITGSKLVRGLPLRGGGSGPAGLIWSLDSLIRATFVGSSAGTWAFDTISASVSVLSPLSIIEYDGIYYWAGGNRFQMFNGVVQELPNQMNLDWFYDNLNYQYRQKCFAFKVPRFGEIWWCYPRGSATECTHAVIFNVREGYWYDTQLPNSGRSSAYYSSAYQHLFATGVDLSGSNYKLWQHETSQMNEVDGSTINPLNSYFETNEITMLEGQQAESLTMRVARMEPDFDQVGDMTLIVKGRANARATDISSATYTFPDTTTIPPPASQTVPLKEARRLMRFRFGSNAVNGDYVMGDCYAHVEPSEGRVTD